MWKNTLHIVYETNSFLIVEEKYNARFSSMFIRSCSYPIILNWKQPQRDDVFRFCNTYYLDIFSSGRWECVYSRYFLSMGSIVAYNSIYKYHIATINNVPNRVQSVVSTVGRSGVYIDRISFVLGQMLCEN